MRAGDAEAGTWARTPGGLCGVGVRGEVQRPQLCTVGRGTGGGWTPGICFPHGIPDLPPAAPWALGPGEDVPRSCRASGCGGPGPGWADGLAPTAPAPRSPCTWVDPRDQGPKEQARADVLRFQGAISGAGGRAAVHGAAHPPPAAPRISHARDVCVCVCLCSWKAAQASATPWAWPQLAPGWCAAASSLLRLCAHGWSEEPARSGPGGRGRGRGYPESPTQPVPNACPHEASTNRTSFFVVI